MYNGNKLFRSKRGLTIVGQFLYNWNTDLGCVIVMDDGALDQGTK